jgi:hypothetical protein
MADDIQKDEPLDGKLNEEHKRIWLFWTCVLFGLLAGIMIVLAPEEFFSLNKLVVPASVGVAAFFVILAVSNYGSKENDLRKGEVRKAIAGALVCTYIIILPFIVLDKDMASQYAYSEKQDVSSEQSTNSTVDEEEEVSEADTKTTEEGETKEETGEDGANTATIDETDSGNIVQKTMGAVLLENFTKLMIFVVTFYFGSRTIETGVEEVRKMREGK